ncbi:zinc-binding alcohol dehydrogenase family protein [Bacillus sp. FJAT-27251]|uniref:zinc-binding alcohol dehydrogenase family protein n=1 Tax=Bacillus sp. FJAT-27251 TaxID=1684142 RepID=UPI0006A77AF7|nr:zinc-binding alcohol dehydrogenase family protein [Bacillus sp. FJAT-27251]
MKAIVCHRPGNMEIEELDNPAAVKDNQVLLEVKRIGVCGTDIHAFSGNQPFFQYPRVLGHELSGVVKETGINVSSIVPGDRVSVIPYMHCGKCIACNKGKTNCCTNMKVAGVHIDGGMAELIVLPESQVIKVNQLSLEEGAIIEPLSIGAHAVRRAAISKKETVLIIGAGPIGLGVAKFAKLQGAKTIVMDINEARLSYSQQWSGCDIVIKPSDRTVEELTAMNNGDLPTVVIDATGNRRSMVSSFDFVAHGGKLVYVGLVKDHITFSDPDFHSKELTLLGSRNATREDFEYVISCVNKGELDTSSYITEKVAFMNTPEYFNSNTFYTNKTLICVNE